MKNFLSKCLTGLLLFIVTASNINAQTILNGVISVDSTLTVAGSPYLVTGNLLVSQNVTLTVNPGVNVQFSSNVGLLLRGRIIANGTQSDSILFTSDNRIISGWEGIKIDNVPGAKIEFSYVRARFSDILFNHQRSIGTDTVIKVENCLLDSNGAVLDMYLASNSNTRQYFNSNVFINNETVTLNGCGSIFKNSSFSNGYSAVRNIYFSSMRTIVDSCTFSNFSYVAVSEYCHITHCTFHDNDLAIAWGGNTIVQYNDIYNNDVGITIGANNGPGLLVHNRICHNIYNIELNYSNDLTAIDNCWCLTDSAIIRSSIYDFFYSFNLGVVDFTPFDTTCSFVDHIPVINELSLDFKIFPNPVRDNLSIVTSEDYSLKTIKIINAIGEVMFSDKVNANEFSIETSSLPKGIYIFEIISGKIVGRKTFVKD